MNANISREELLNLNKSDAHNKALKRAMSQRINLDTKEFLRKGGKVQAISPQARTEKPHKLEYSKKKMRDE